MFLIQPQSTKSIFIQVTITEFEPFYFLESFTTMAMGRERESGDERGRYWFELNGFGLRDLCWIK